MYYCTNCGYALPEGSKFCQNCGASIDAEGNATPRATAAEPAPAAPVQQDAYQNPYAQQDAYQNPYAAPAQERRISGTPYLIWAIVATILCFWPTGIPAIVYAARINRCGDIGDLAAAREAARKSRTWTIVTAVVGIIVGIIGAVLLVGYFANYNY